MDVKHQYTYDNYYFVSQVLLVAVIVVVVLLLQVVDLKLSSLKHAFKCLQRGNTFKNTRKRGMNDLGGSGEAVLEEGHKSRRVTSLDVN